MPKEKLLNLGAGKGDGFRGDRKGYSASNYWCQNDTHAGYGKPKHACIDCIKEKEDETR